MPYGSSPAPFLAGMDYNPAGRRLSPVGQFGGGAVAGAGAGYTPFGGVGAFSPGNLAQGMMGFGGAGSFGSPAAASSPSPQETPGNRGSGAGRLARGVLGAFDGEDGMQRLAAVSMGLGALANIYAEHQRGERDARDRREEERRRKGMSERLDSFTDSVRG